MKTGAVIVAAGMSSRMGAFKPMLRIGSISAARRIVSTFLQAGVETVVVVTGNRADELEKHLAGNGVVFIRNPDYETTQMFDSAKLGLTYIMDKCDFVLFTPVDVPLFTASTVEALLQNSADIVIPVCNGGDGHPLLISSAVLPKIIENDGSEGLKGAVRASGAHVKRINVDDRGVLCDMDTPDDYEELLKLHNSQLFRPVTELRLAREETFFGPEEACLLKLIDETGSVKTACTRLKLSYSKGWTSLHRIERGVGRPAVESIQGGPEGGSSKLTETGHELLERFEALEADCRAFAEERFSEYFPENL